MILHTFGDSHSIYPWNNVHVDGLIIKIHPNRAKTCASFGMEKLNICNIRDREFGINDGDFVCFCFGETDCRANLSKPQNFNMYINLIDEIVLRYFEAIKINVGQFQNLTTMVYNVIPPWRADELDFKKFTTTLFGSNEDRKTLTLYMNSKLKEYCKKYNYIFFDVYDKYCDDDGFCIEKYKEYRDVHILDGIYVAEFLKNLINIKNNI